MVGSPYQAYTMIPRREFNPEISAFSNLLLDLVDFKDRVRPMASDIARHDAANIYQRYNVNEMEQQMGEFREGLGQGAEDAASEAAVSVEEGYSSLEIAAESGADEAGAEAGEDDAAEPDHEAAVEEDQSEDAEEKNEGDEGKKE